MNYDKVSLEFTREKAEQIMGEVTKIVVGQEQFIRDLIIVLFAKGHVLIEGVPGIAKTLTAKVLSLTIGANFKRVQFTPDLMPSDIIGTKIYNLKKGEFYVKKGPIFTNIFLADEINRTPPKTQSALLEAMEERAITIDGETFKLAEPFFVVATQNPVEYEGTYPLPEAQLDRFMMKLNVNYMAQNYENDMLEMFHKGFDSSEFNQEDVKKIITPDELQRCREEIKKVEVSSDVINYITSIVRATRNSRNLMLGASPRASISMLHACKTFAAISGRSFVTPEDVKDMALPILRHRIILKPEVGIDGIDNDTTIVNILNKIEVPR